jgi:hypothetical protein
LLEVKFVERRRESALEPILGEVVHHFEEAREIDDPRRVAVGESNRMEQGKGFGQGLRPRATPVESSR